MDARTGTSTKFAGSSCNDLICIGGGSTIISGHFDKRIRFWDIRADVPTQEVSLPGKITSLDVSADQNYLSASVREDSIEVLDLRMNSVVGQYRFVKMKKSCLHVYGWFYRFLEILRSNILLGLTDLCTTMR